YVQVYTSCSIEYSIPPEKVLDDARQVEKERYGYLEIVSDEARAYLDGIAAQSGGRQT
ncbi:MAG TPA: ferredoxin oxidoreductase, partial [Clostridiales bacterium]|nr:ferredoxin oxidoreductase [Clostridiales bacterium]